ncbi:MAG: hypothetical protein ACM3S1_16330 [Hyphomicrobiales bacterium]
MDTVFAPAVRKQLLAWLGMPFLAIANGVVRETTYGRAMGEDASHSLSTAPLLVLIGLYTWFTARRWPLATRAQALAVGLGGFLFATGFEFGFGRLEGRSWSELFRDNNILAGRLWILVPLAVLVAPELHRRRRLQRAEPDAAGGREFRRAA